MKRNTDPAFVGIQKLKDRQREQLELFRSAARSNDWMGIHTDHYDWWMFPTDEPSSYGFAWTVFEGDVAELKQDPAYVASYLEGVELLAASWGWDLDKASHLVSLQPGQAWQHWPIRLYKAAKSLKLFGFERQFQSLKKLGQEVMNKGEKMYYHRDLSWIFKD